MSYTELSIEERVAIQIGQYRDLSQREIARLLGRSCNDLQSKWPRPAPIRFDLQSSTADQD
ncbi:hypothetical protein ALQ31_100242 [Pseudomonas amygdali pv. morsprunorum]|uniref:Transposase IS30-like HTH domain-containing protein n=2 Tax=Pseudomonas syringae group TaxID=136849 RepID=A0A2K4X2H8_PSESX|nr:Uncharacterized protein ALO63_02610 [Pseudomonas amygdali pv. mori]RMO16426.1 hypothetical protein ALQ45_101212 [Pseudomonas amygdali pv. morsprunorum]SOS37724.1 hypothetical protein CFBP3840_00658 [Pseudomonas syringae]RMP00318.1 hypothetical protein ALQ31_100242 [Pseudomonas amygdali pv. morsprunorum]RMU26470.1 hypothetical protein ALP31_200147 [Pseudomonas amygdali pv. morsprunorum]